MARSGFTITHHFTAAQISAGEADALIGGFVEVIDTSGQPTGVVMETGPMGSTPTIVGVSASSVTSQPASLAGTGTIALTEVLHAGKNWHVESGQTSVTLATANWPNGGELTLVNHSGIALPVVLSGTWGGGFVNEIEGNTAVTGTLATIPPLSRAIVQVKDGNFVNLALLGGSGGPVYEDWAATTRVRMFEVRRATAAVNDIKIGDLIRSIATRTTGSTFNATEVVNWIEISSDPVQSVAGKVGVVTLVKGDVGLGSVDNTTDIAKPVSTATQTLLDTKQATLVSGTNVKTLNSQSILGAGNLAVGASAASVTTNSGGTGGTVTQVGNDRVHTFTANGNFVVPTGVSSVRVLVVGGGGGGGSGRYRGDTAGRPAGGGGAGGLIHNSSFAVTSGSTIAVTVGAGGAGATDLDDTVAGVGGVNGNNSIFSSLVATGGGHGGGHKESIGAGWDTPASSGGSGGGSSNGSTGAAGTAGQGNSGGNGVLSGSLSAGGGGGGAGGIGGNGNGTTGAAGAGGAGLSNDITGSSITYAVGGAGSHNVANTGHTGGNATVVGGGGEGSYDGGSGSSATAKPAGAGANGIVIVRYIYQSLDTPVYANNSAAIAGGLTLGMLYRTGVDPDTLCVVH